MVTFTMRNTIKLMTRTQASQHFGIAKSQVDRLVSNGLVPLYEIEPYVSNNQYGRFYANFNPLFYVNPQDLDRWIDACRQDLNSWPQRVRLGPKDRKSELTKAIEQAMSSVTNKQ